jgi:ATP-dependent RNA helicase RhlE
VSKALERGDIKSATIHGEKDQKDRTDVMDRFKSGEMNILIATDVSARGIDIADVNYVINYDLPEKSENYVHRVGRTGRGIKKGIAISFCSPEEKERLDAIQGFLNKKIEMIPISKKEHKDTIALTNETDNIQDLIMEQEEWEKKKRTKRKKKK